MPTEERSWPDWKYPTWRNGTVTLQRWLDGKKQADGAEGLWRIHDKLYDLSSWVHSHPGGSEWLIVTEGTDITEAFESHHVGPLASKILPNFYVRPAKVQRDSVFTFKENGFYRTLKSRAYEKIKNVKPGPSSQSKMILDSLATGTIILSILAVFYHSLFFAIVAGIFLTQTTIVAHNFFHMRDNWRMYFFNLSLLTVREWRISHALSHHLFPNTHYDLEIAMFEPFLEYLPKSDKNKLIGILSMLYSPVAYTLLYFGSALLRLFTSRPQAQDLICLILPTLMVIVGQQSVWDTLVMWAIILMVSSFVFGVIGLNAAHHHPDIFHYGDKPRDDRDWGLFTLDATRDRVEVYGTPYLVLTTFGDHTLHHLFPTVDHAHLYDLYPILEKTCKEFGIDFKLKTTWELVLGQFRQLLRNKPNQKERSY